MRVVTSLRSSEQEDGSIVVRRHGRVFVLDERNPRRKARQA